MKVLVACEFSGVVAGAFRKRGHYALSCDLLPAEDNQDYHYHGDVRDIINWDWDLMIAHPPCTRLATSGNRWRKGKEKEEQEAIDFVQMLMDAPISKIAIENPVGILSTRIRKPDQIVQPWWFGDEATKTTCLWLKNLPPLVPTKIVSMGTEAYN
jgi:site-specific DNA-cytosine methylase